MNADKTKLISSVFICVHLWTILFFASNAPAHPEGFSGLRVMVWTDRVQAVLTLHTRDMSRWFPPGNYPDYVADVCRVMEKSPDDSLEIHLDDEPVKVKTVHAFSPETGMIEVDFEYPIDRAVATLYVWSKHLGNLPNGHQQLVFIEDMSSGARASLQDETFDASYNATSVKLPARFQSGATTKPTTTATTSPARAQTPQRPSISFFMLGVEHILTGYDHLLFLAALLLVCKTFKEAASVITFFTIAHSITLTLAALDVVRLPDRIVEPAIAASIVYVGLENIFGKHVFFWRALVTFSFGLVHGLGFAGALRDIGLGSSQVGLVMPLFKFALGLESVQLCIAFLTLAIMLNLRKMPRFERQWVPACSVLVAMLGGYWLVTRVMAG